VLARQSVGEKVPPGPSIPLDQASSSVTRSRSSRCAVSRLEEAGTTGELQNWSSVLEGREDLGSRLDHGP
jgi:hypothetical protein